jgi:2-haloacid dehalogenase
VREGRPVLAVVFDAYGTLFDLHAAMARHAGRLGEGWEATSALWRQKQLEYAWVTTLTGPEHWRDFEALTREALLTALNWNGGASLEMVDRLMAAWRALPAFPDAADALAALRARGLSTAILSNGSRAMLAAAVKAAGLGALLDAVLSVDAVRAYKPDPRAYRLAEDAFRLHASRIAFVSANPWDAQAAAAYGFRTVWVNRIGQPTEFALHQVAAVAADLASLPGLLVPDDEGAETP